MSMASVNETELDYVTVGDGLPCLVMHGGLGFDHTYLHPWLDPLGDTLKLVYYDHRGNGRSGRPDKETMTHAQFAADVDALSSHLGFDKVAVIGHSYGGFIIIWPLYFKTFNADIAHRLLENSIINASGGACEGELSAYNVVSRLGEIHRPTLILVGRDDFICPPSQAHILRNGITNSELVIFENSGHLPYVEEAEAFFDSVRDWIKRTT